MKINLRCTGYELTRVAHEFVEIRPVFLLGTLPNNSKEIAEALKRIELYLSGEVNLLKSDGSNRCFYCGCKQEDNAVICSQCGAPL